VESDALVHGADYGLWLDGRGPFPDPRSSHQPHGVMAPSRWVDHAQFSWHDAQWRPPAPKDAIIYELHIGTFTREGTFDSAIARLDALHELGITHVEVMPVAQFPGTHGWGYDGVDLYAPHHVYGGPHGMKCFVDACHQRGLAVILDVVYNHLGPEGNWLEQFGPYFTGVYQTPWGKAVNLDNAHSHEVRRFLIDNALMWLRDYHIDGLRVDAVHAFIDRSAIHFLEQLVSEVKALGLLLQREVFVIAESDLNDPRVIRPVAQGGLGADAQWNEDFHHALHTLLTKEEFGYYADFGKLSDLARVFGAGFCYDDRHSRYRQRHHGRSAAGLEGWRFVACMQNHDQVGSRGNGERIGRLVSQEKLKLGAALTLLSPFVPMLFQGEEWGASSPFLYFTDFVDRNLQDAVRKGRKSEMAAFGWQAGIPDPQAASTWWHSQLIWEEREQAPHRDILRWYTALITLRKQEKDFGTAPLDPQHVIFDEEQGWLSLRRGRFQLVCNFADRTQSIACEVPCGLRLASSENIRNENGRLLLPPYSIAVLEPSEAGASS
ncbi:MAG: malto-oligosyltrehalose trehalohydrolase, partial [Pseudomonadota bacterium]